jgi:hypothetical protein
VICDVSDQRRIGGRESSNAFRQSGVRDQCIVQERAKVAVDLRRQLAGGQLTHVAG